MSASMRKWATNLKDAIVRPADPPRQAMPTPGQQAEALAADWLSAQGLRILARNARCRGGEIDLIGLEGDTLVFVEVRLRSNPRFGSAADSITASKRARIVLAARHWLATAGRAHAARPCRFDVLLFDRLDTPAPQWLRAAFAADD